MWYVVECPGLQIPLNLVIEWKGVTEPSNGVSDHIEMQVDITGVNYLLRLPLDIFAVVSWKVVAVKAPQCLLCYRSHTF